MSEENINAGTSAENAVNAGASKVVADKINQYSGKVDGWVERAIGIIGNHPWDSWLATANGCITKYLPAVIALSGVLACLTGLVTMIKADMPFSDVIKPLFLLIPVLFSVHLAPKALALTRSFVEKGEPIVIRPELMCIMKVVFGIGGILLGVFLLLNFEAFLIVPAIAAILYAALMIVCLERPAVVGVKPGYPTNCVEEIISLFLFPYRVVIALLTPLIGLAAVCGLVFGVVMWFNSGLQAMIVMGVTAIVPFAVPLALYFIYLLVVFTLDFYKAIVSIPRKLDELKDNR